jgi:hypothetical protein
MNFNYPFYNDGLSYVGRISAIILEPILKTKWNLILQNQGTVFFLFHTLCGSLINLNYSTLIYSQILLTFIEILLIVFLLRHLKLFPNIHWYTLLTIFILLFSSAGYFTAVPGNIFDFRLDLSASLLLIPTLICLLLKPSLSLFFVPLAILERFHNITLISLSLPVIFFYHLVIFRTHTKNDRSVAYKGIIFILFSLFLTFLLKVDFFIDQFKYYTNMQLSDRF